MPDKKVLIFLLGEMATITFLIIIISTIYYHHRHHHHHHRARKKSHPVVWDKKTLLLGK